MGLSHGTGKQKGRQIAPDQSTTQHQGIFEPLEGCQGTPTNIKRVPSKHQASIKMPSPLSNKAARITNLQKGTFNGFMLSVQASDDTGKDGNSPKATGPKSPRPRRRGKRGIRKFTVPRFTEPRFMAIFVRIKCVALMNQVSALRKSHNCTTLESQVRRSKVLMKRKQTLESLASVAWEERRFLIAQHVPSRWLDLVWLQTVADVRGWLDRIKIELLEAPATEAFLSMILIPAPSPPPATAHSRLCKLIGQDDCEDC